MKALAALVAACMIAPPEPGFAAAPAADATPSSLPAELFVAPPDMSRPLLSPSGDALAVLVRDRDGRRELAVIDISHPDSLKMNIAARAANADVFDVQWVDDTRLVFNIGHELESMGDLTRGSTWAVDRSDDDLIELKHAAFHDVGRSLHDGTSDVIAYRSSGGDCSGNAVRWHCEGGYRLPVRLDTRTDTVRALVSPPLPDHAASWLIDGAGKVRGVVTENAGETSLHVPPEVPGEWRRIAHFHSAAPGNGFGIEGFGADGRLYVTQSSDTPGGADTLDVMDLATGKMSAHPVVSVKGFDFRGSLVQDWSRHRVLGVHYEADADGTVWFDPEMAALQKRVDEALPGLVNRIDPADCGCAARMLVTSWSDRQAPLFHLFDRKTGQLTLIGGTHPALAPESMASTSFERITARDGHDLPVYVTRPHGKGPWRTCIEGGSYGGYATLMGLVRYPDLYRCGIASAAVTDLGLMYDLWWSDANDEWKNYGMPLMVGDPVKDADQFVATSPLAQAARITRPLLLAHGGLDRRVPVEHATRLRDALVAHGAPVTWILYRDEGHGWSSPGNRADWFRQMEKFLAANDGPVPAH